MIDLPNVQDQTRPQLARSVLLGARSVTVQIVVCGAWLGSVVFISAFEYTIWILYSYDTILSNLEH